MLLATSCGEMTGRRRSTTYVLLLSPMDQVCQPRAAAVRRKYAPPLAACASDQLSSANKGEYLNTCHTHYLLLATHNLPLATYCSLLGASYPLLTPRYTFAMYYFFPANRCNLDDDRAVP